MGAAEKFLDAMESLFDKEALIFKGQSAQDGLIEPAVLVWKDVPERGFMTCVTYGLSLGNHPKWQHHRKPELIMTLHSDDEAWAIELADMVARGRGEIPFSYGQMIHFNRPIVQNSVLSGMLIFAPYQLEQEDYLDIPVGNDYTICLSGAYPVAQSEMDLASARGVKALWTHPAFDFENVFRVPVSE